MKQFVKSVLNVLPITLITLFCLTSNASATLDAQLISDNIPGEMHPGERRRLTVVMENTGDEPWIGTDFRFQSISNPSDTWSFTTFLLEDDDNIAPGQQKSFIIYLDAPATPGTYESKWQMKKASDNALFGDIVLDSIWVDESVTPEWDALIVNHTLPTELSPGEPRLVTVTLENTGAGDWTGDRYALSARKNDPDDLWSTENYLMLGDDETVSPGEQRTFTFIITAPFEEAIYDCNWQMLHIHIWSYFGELLSEPINVSSSVTPELGSLLISNTIPTDMYPGETRSATITLENTGTVTWDEDNVRLYAPDSTWGYARTYYLDSGETISQNEQKTFTIVITAPSEEGIYNCSWQMRGVWNWGEGNKYSYFGANVSAPVNVDNSITPELDATLVSHTIPSIIAPLETVSVIVTIENTGFKTWHGNDPNWIRFRSINSPANLWGIYNINLDTGDEIEPGQQKTFSFNITAHSTPDIYQCKWQMQKHWPNPNTFFGELIDVTVTVGNTGCDDNYDCGICQKCEAGSCVFQTDTEDLKDDCSDGECTTGFCDETGACGLEPATNLCRTSAGICDQAEYCTGTSAYCPADIKSTDVCRVSQGVCDITEFCDGVSIDCPTDAKSTDVCRASQGVCDITESCDGMNDDCPADELIPDGTFCNDGFFCNGTDTCNGGTCIHSGNPCTTPPLDCCDEDNETCIECAATYTLTIDFNPAGSGTTNPSAGSYIYNEDDVVTISASPDAGYQFAYWTGEVADPNAQTTTVIMDSDKTVTANFEESGLTPEPSFISLNPDTGSSSVATPVNFTLTAGDGDGYQDLKTVKFVIKEGTGTGTSSDAIVIEYRSYRPDRIWIWNHIEGRWKSAVVGTSTIIEDSLYSLDASQCSISGDGDILTLNLNITPKDTFIEDPLTGQKRIWLLLRDIDNNTINNLEIGSWTVTN